MLFVELASFEQWVIFQLLSIIFQIMLNLLFRPYDQKNPFLAPISVNRELHKGGDRSCMHIELDITQAKLR